jgi:hypothetical protein
MAVARVASAVAAYTAARGQFGLAGGGATGGYIAAARVMHALGGDVVVDDRSNSFHELLRKRVVEGVQNFVDSLHAEQRETVGAVILDLMGRTVSADIDSAFPRSTYIFPNGERRRHDALVQGSAESSILEAFTYARKGWRHVEGGVRAEFHDDGYTAITPSTAVSSLQRPETDDGSVQALGKNYAIGPRAADIVAAGHAAAVADVIWIAGVPVGDMRVVREICREAPENPRDRGIGPGASGRSGLCPRRAGGTRHAHHASGPADARRHGGLAARGLRVDGDVV